MGNIIQVFCVGSNGKMISLTYDSKNFTQDTAEESVRNHGFTVIYSTMTV